MTTMTYPPADARRVFGGVNTHKDLHVAAALDELGRLLATQSFPTTAAGYMQLWRWMGSHGEVVAVGIEGIGSSGAGLARDLVARGVDVREVMRPSAPSPLRQVRRGRRDRRGAYDAGRAWWCSGCPPPRPSTPTGQLSIEWQPDRF